MKKVELLAPAGTKEAFIAALQNGADAIYVGGQSFGARAYAKNFTNEELVELFNYAHIRGVKVYVTVNTLVLEEEFESVKEYLSFLYINQCDGVIVQDLGVISYLRNTYPDFKIVGSTQMNIHNVEGAKFAKSLGLSRVVLARETTIEEVKEIKKNVDIELEVFGHGALCICYSGQCLMSSFIGERSGNRGRCAQSCRLNYRLKKNDEYLCESQPLLSTKDLLTLDNLPKLLESKISSIKIEGRMKSPEYVAQVVSTYKKAIDNYYKKKFNENITQDIYNLKRVFNRDFTKGYILNEIDYNVVNINRNNHQGVEIGKVIQVSKDLIRIGLSKPLNQFDGIRIVSLKEDVGFNVNKMEVKGLLVNKASQGDTITLRGRYNVKVNDIVLKTTDVELLKSLQLTFDKDYRKVNLKAILNAQIGELLSLSFIDSDGHKVTHTSSFIVIEANNEGLNKEKAFEQIGKLGNTAYNLFELEFNSQKALVPFKLLNELRVKCVESLNKLRINKYPNRVLKKEVFLTLPKTRLPKNEIGVLINKKEQILPLLNKNINYIYVKGKRLFTALKNEYPKENIIYAYNRIEDYKYLNNDLSMISENGGLALENTNIHSDIYLNISNSRAVAFLTSLNVKRIGISLEISKHNLDLMVENFKKFYYTNPLLMMNVYGHNDLMITKYCPISKINGNKKKHCQECYLNNYFLEDRMKVAFPIKGDENCIMHIYNSRRLHLLEYLRKIMEVVTLVRLDFVNESKEEVDDIINAYLQVFNNVLFESKKLDNVTYGHYKSGVM